MRKVFICFSECFSAQKWLDTKTGHGRRGEGCWRGSVKLLQLLMGLLVAAPAASLCWCASVWSVQRAMWSSDYATTSLSQCICPIDPIQDAVQQHRAHRTHRTHRALWTPWRMRNANEHFSIFINCRTKLLVSFATASDTHNSWKDSEILSATKGYLVL